MINQLSGKSYIDVLYFSLVLGYSSLPELYLQMITQLRKNPTAISVCPCCNQKDMEWELFASYFRTVIDLVPCMENGEYCREEDGTIMFETDPEKCTFRMEIKRIKCMNCASGDTSGKPKCHTHAVLGSLLVPYLRHSIRFIVYHLYKMSRSGKTMQEYCTANLINVSDVKKWTDWLNDAIPALIALRLLPEEVNSCSDTREQLKKVVRCIYEHFTEFYSAVFLNLKKVMFQRHAMPPFTRYFPDSAVS